MEQPSGNIDELLRQRLQHTAVPPPEFVWPNVEKALRRRKRRVFFWLLAVGVAGSGIWSVWNRPVRTLNPLAVALPEAPAPRAGTGTGQPAPAAWPGEGKTAADRAAAANSTPRPSTGQVPAAAPTRPQWQAKGTATVPQTTVSETAGSAMPLPERQALQPTPGSSGAASAPAFEPALAELLPGRLSSLANQPRKPLLAPVQLQTSAKKAPRRCYDFHGNRQAWLFDVYAGPSFVRKSVSTNNPEYKAYAQDRLATEHRELAFNAGVQASYLFAENFLVRAGLHYDQFVEKFEYIDPDYIKYTVEITQKIVNGVLVTVPDTVKIEYGSNYVKTYNRFGLLDIPLQAALELRSGPTGISLNLGGSVNLLFWKRGSMLALNGEPAEFTPGKHKFDVFKTKVGMSLVGSIQWFYHISPRTRVFAEPYYRRIIEPVMQGGYPVEQTYGIGGVRFGVTRIFD